MKTRPSLPRAAVACPLVLALACSSPPDPRPDLGGPPASFLGFPALSHEHSVYAIASFEPEQEDVFDTDLVATQGVIPVRLEVGLRGEDAMERAILLNPDQWDLVLYLQDGTALRRMEAEEVASVARRDTAERVRSLKFRPGFLRTEPTKGFVFFALEPRDDYEVEGRELVHVRGDLRRSVDLYHSLMAFRVTIDDELHPFYVGIQPR